VFPPTLGEGAVPPPQKIFVFFHPKVAFSKDFRGANYEFSSLSKVIKTQSAHVD